MLKRSMFLIIAVGICALLPHSANAQITWNTSLSDAKRAAAAAGKPLLVVFHATWCGPCKMLEETTLKDKRVTSLLANVVCARIDIDKDMDSAKAYHVDAIPRTILLPAGGGSATMDLLGYREAPDFQNSLADALHIKIAPGSANPDAASPATAIGQVRSALASKSYAALKKSNPKVAAAGLAQLVEQLGSVEEQDVKDAADLFGSAGGDAIPALLAGMSNRYLAVRAGSFRTIQTLSRAHTSTQPPHFDPWAAPAERKRQIQAVAVWLSASNRPVSAR